MSFKQQNVAHSWSTSAVAMLAALLGCNGGGHSGNNDAPPTPEQGHRRELTLTSPVQTQAGQNLDCGGITVSMPLTTGDMVVEDVLFTVGTGNSAVLARAGLERLRSALTTCVRPALSKVMIFGLLIAGLTCHIAQAQTALAPTQPLVSAEGELVGYATFDTDTYFLVPSAWLLARDARGPMATLSEVATDPSTYNLRVVLEPSYTKAAAVVVQLRRSNPNALFLPLPTRLTKVQLYLPRALGAITASLEPDSQFPSPLAVYYRVKLNAGQVNILRDLAQGGVTLQGAVTYAYIGNGGEQRTSTPLTIQLDPSIFIRRQNTDRGLAWLSDMLAKSELYIPRVLDGSYDLGGSMQVTLQNTVLRGSFVGNSQRLVRTGNMVQNVELQSPNFRGVVTCYLAELSLPIDLSFDADLMMSFDLKTVNVSLQTLEIKGVRLNGNASSLYTEALRQLFLSPDVIAALSRELTAELQRRVLSHSLFGLEGVLS